MSYNIFYVLFTFFFNSQHLHFSDKLLYLSKFVWICHSKLHIKNKKYARLILQLNTQFEAEQCNYLMVKVRHLRVPVEASWTKVRRSTTRTKLGKISHQRSNDPFEVKKLIQCTLGFLIFWRFSACGSSSIISFDYGFCWHLGWRWN